MFPNPNKYMTIPLYRYKLNIQTSAHTYFEYEQLYKNATINKKVLKNKNNLLQNNR